jgi:hypothetical protein
MKSSREALPESAAGVRNWAPKPLRVSIRVSKSRSWVVKEPDTTVVIKNLKYLVVVNDWGS